MIPERHPNHAIPIMTPTPEMLAEEARFRAAHPQGIKTAEVRESIRKDAKRLLTPLYERIQRQRGLPKKHVVIR